MKIDSLARICDGLKVVDQALARTDSEAASIIIDFDGTKKQYPLRAVTSSVADAMDAEKITIDTDITSTADGKHTMNKALITIEVAGEDPGRTAAADAVQKALMARGAGEGIRITKEKTILLIYPALIATNAALEKAITAICMVLDAVYSGDGVTIRSRAGITIDDTSEVAEAIPDLSIITPDIFKKLFSIYPRHAYTGTEHGGKYLAKAFNIAGWLSDRLGPEAYTTKAKDDLTVYTLRIDPVLRTCPGYLVQSKTTGRFCYFNANGNPAATFSSLRAVIDPTAQEIELRKKARAIYARHMQREPSPEQIELAEKEWLNFAEINCRDTDSYYIRTGISEVDDEIVGFSSGAIHIISGYPGNGKSKFVSQIALQAIADGYQVAYYSGEQQATDTKIGMIRQLTGRNARRQIPDNLSKALDAYVGDDLKIRNHLTQGHDYQKLCAAIENLMKTPETASDLIIIDNLMTLSCPEAQNQLDSDKIILAALHDIAIKYRTVILLVAHPRKDSGGVHPIMSMSDISGSAELMNYAYSIIQIGRSDDSYQQHYAEIYHRTHDDTFTRNAFLHLLKTREDDAKLPTGDFMGLCYNSQYCTYSREPDSIQELLHNSRYERIKDTINNN